MTTAPTRAVRDGAPCARHRGIGRDTSPRHGLGHGPATKAGSNSHLSRRSVAAVAGPVPWHGTPSLHHPWPGAGEAVGRGVRTPFAACVRIGQDSSAEVPSHSTALFHVVATLHAQAVNAPGLKHSLLCNTHGTTRPRNHLNVLHVSAPAWARTAGGAECSLHSEDMQQDADLAFRRSPHRRQRPAQPPPHGRSTHTSPLPLAHRAGRHSPGGPAAPPSNPTRPRTAARAARAR